jgi:hypothetical protein
MRFSLLFFLVFCLIGCDEKKQDLDFKAFDGLLLDLRRADYGYLSKEGVDSLKAFVKNSVTKSKDGRLKRWIDESGEVIIDSLANYVKISKGGILNVPSRNFSVNFFLENSASMDGYLSSASNDFKKALFGLLSDLKNNSGGIVSNLDLYHINTAITDSVRVDKNAVLDDFIFKLNPQAFRQLGIKNKGNRAQTDMHDLLKQVLQKVDEINVAILVSDFIFSPGKAKAKTAAEFIDAQSMSIRGSFAEKRASQDLAVYILKMESDFTGKYFLYNDSPVDYDAKKHKPRPYYIWFIGSPIHIAKIAQNQSIITSMKQAGYKEGESVIFESYKEGAERQPEFNLVLKKSNNKVVCNPRNAKRTILVKDTKDFNCSIDFNFGDNFRPSAFYSNKDNYKIEAKNNFDITIGEPKKKNFELNLALSADKVNWGEVKISVVDKMPSWVKEAASKDDFGILGNPLEQGRTYGFEELVTGVFRGFYPDILPDSLRVLQTLSINIQKEQ